MRHEKSCGHLGNVEERNAWDMNVDADAWAESSPTGLFDKFGERMEFVDQLRDFIPFWRDTIEAAKRGETLRFEDFLENVRRNNADRDGWGGWGATTTPADWGITDTPQHASDSWDPTEREKRKPSIARSDDSVSSGFAEMVAQLSPTLDCGRRERMRSFYKVRAEIPYDMILSYHLMMHLMQVPTQTKIELIQQLINDLQATPV